jgi:hypothetical protein
MQTATSYDHPLTIGISGGIGSGKTTVVEMLKRHLNCKVKCYNFADALKAIVCSACSVPYPLSEENKSSAVDLSKGVPQIRPCDLPERLMLAETILSRINAQIRAATSDSKPVTVGLMLQVVGQAFKKAVDDDFWINCLANCMASDIETPDVVIVGDVRYPNEANYIKDVCGGVLVGVFGGPKHENSLAGRDPAHPSEQGLGADARWFERIDNSGSIESLESKVVDLVGCLKKMT